MYSSGPEHSRITALLGPTNTGKTHRAVERMLEHDTGVIGLPLRLLAREVYDRISAKVGENRVALLTGEEQRVPPRPSYWVCTVEAMPALDVDFLAVDEIQLAAHRERGHVFTDRLLHARGRKETWFLGASSMAPLLAKLVPTASVVSQPRLSTLRHRGKSSLRSLPRRSAIVAFSVAEVYDIAEKVRQARGGAAVVLGALSPRTRNAQVAMYQAGEVDVLVASDAIGMGLNLDLDHVAFASSHKFDGFETRPLTSAELGQIAGRAGRYTNDGSFGSLTPLPAFPESLALDIEHHRFPALNQLIWRNRELGFATSSELIASLREAPGHGALRRVEHAEDFSALMTLAGREAVRARTGDEDRVRLLWEVCQIPDYRKLLRDTHTALLFDIFLQLADAGEIDETWLRQRIDELDGPSTDVDTLMTRLSFVRTWTYVSHRRDWLRHASEWQARTRALEDRLSDALHESLVSRFVERSRGHSSSREPASRTSRREPAPEARSAPSSPFAALVKLRERLPTESPLDWAEAAIAAKHGELSCAMDLVVSVHSRGVARLKRGSHLLRPALSLLDEETLAPGTRLRLERRLVAWSRDFAAECWQDFAEPAAALASAPVRGLLYQLGQGLGAALVSTAKDQLGALSDADRELLAQIGVNVGRRYVFVPALLEPGAMQRRAVLCRAFFGRASSRIAAGARSAPLDVPAWRHAESAAELLCNGVVTVGQRLLRIDALESIFAHLETPPSEPSNPLDEVAALAGLAEDGCRDTAAELLLSLGYRPGPDGRYRARSRRRRSRRRRPLSPSSRS